MSAFVIEAYVRYASVLEDGQEIVLRGLPDPGVQTDVFLTDSVHVGASSDVLAPAGSRVRITFEFLG